MNAKQLEALVKLRDALAMGSEAVNELIDTFAPKAVKEEKSAVLEETFSTLKFEPQKGARLGDYETATEKNNLADKFRYAMNILSKANAVISRRYSGAGYAFTYWIYNERIFRQLKR